MQSHRAQLMKSLDGLVKTLELPGGPAPPDPPEITHLKHVLLKLLDEASSVHEPKPEGSEHHDADGPDAKPTTTWVQFLDELLEFFSVRDLAAGTLRHHCAGPGCCKSPAHSRKII